MSNKFRAGGRIVQRNTKSSLVARANSTGVSLLAYDVLKNGINSACTGTTFGSDPTEIGMKKAPGGDTEGFSFS